VADPLGAAEEAGGAELGGAGSSYSGGGRFGRPFEPPQPLEAAPPRHAIESTAMASPRMPVLPALPVMLRL
jgi:hypothetical protein